MLFLRRRLLRRRRSAGFSPPNCAKSKPRPEFTMRLRSPKRFRCSGDQCQFNPSIPIPGCRVAEQRLRPPTEVRARRVKLDVDGSIEFCTMRHDVFLDHKLGDFRFGNAKRRTIPRRRQNRRFSTSCVARDASLSFSFSSSSFNARKVSQPKTAPATPKSIPDRRRKQKRRNNCNEPEGRSCCQAMDIVAAFKNGSAADEPNACQYAKRQAHEVKDDKRIQVLPTLFISQFACSIAKQAVLAGNPKRRPPVSGSLSLGCAGALHEGLRSSQPAATPIR